MREIKFRAWEKHLKEIIPVYDIDFDFKQINTNKAWRRFDEVELMQYTGLKDKNGKDIYEGDIIATDDYAVAMLKHWGKKTEEKISLYEIKFFEGRYMLFDKNSWVAVLNHHVMSKANELTVVGNFYENHELLEKSK
ncbi:YopX family protein [Mesobacillus subterraneus]|uniref:YopX family protein n=1 Tax=Mesobacillus subterraneus TaxID=285983 RepID=UPI001CFD4EB8|nr:YopX family protein [Mesobacillus subterraneus]WLR53579.1 YopX family protein [Mesobacillus subterraneus]